jgi:hypothetical protein
MIAEDPRTAAGSERLDEKVQRQLDEALADSFPASDPVSIVTSQEEEDWGAETDPSAVAEGPPQHNPTEP